MDTSNEGAETKERPSIGLHEKTPPDTKEPATTTHSSDKPAQIARDWPYAVKLRTTCIIGAYRFISALASSALSFALPSIAAEFNTLDRKIVSVLPLSAYLLGYVFGPLILAPLSSTFGRVRVLQASNMVFLVFNTAAGFAQNTTTLSVLRACSGLGGSGPITLAAGILSDCWTPLERTRMIVVYTLPVQLGPALAPIMGALLNEHLSWRWILWVTSISSVVVQIIGFCLLRETHVPAIGSGGQNKLVSKIKKELTLSFKRPVRIFRLHYSTQLLALYASFTYAVVYATFVSFHDVWEKKYNQNASRASLNFTALAAGEIIGSFGVRPFNVWSYNFLRCRSDDGLARPEFRAPALVLGGLLLPIGLIWFGFSAQERIFPVVPDLGVAVYAIAGVIILQFTNLYVIDVYEGQAAEAMSGIYAMRYLVGFALSLFISDMFDVLDYGFGNALLAGLSILFGWPLPWLIWRFGERLRARDAPVV
ncbi:hypothetical protein EG328_002769 [Venturia inaequalis]|uniref:Major facilitator superfamily (MFS) profile domain-containing protein n=1 Tax=Venturia inaequalis TaxID=5025 RepID=A0A8H3Z8T6_VENIN|nr:hypothetical protein EG328_002769 [Venturia inaequalis]KAE9994324.1 hypothetical protein EG327_011426 [Venturia inaequalis]RDI86760.1 hypothetical protein Vi05172_g3240 [Venturia inaequalis]